MGFLTELQKFNGYHIRDMTGSMHGNQLFLKLKGEERKGKGQREDKGRVGTGVEEKIMCRCWQRIKEKKL